MKKQHGQNYLYLYLRLVLSGKMLEREDNINLRKNYIV
jgi:hypothetical protein